MVLPEPVEGSDMKKRLMVVSMLRQAQQPQAQQPQAQAPIRFLTEYLKIDFRV